MSIRNALQRCLMAATMAATFSFAPAPGAAIAREALTFGIVPQQSATRLAQDWVPFLRELGKGLPFRLDFATAKDIPTFEACLAQGAYDVAYMNPYHYVVFHEIAAYRAFAIERGKKLNGVIVVRKDSPLRSLRDLGGQRIAFPSPAAFGASVIPRAEMTRMGISFTPVYVKSHDSVYRAVASRALVAGGGVRLTFDNIAPDLRDQMRIIYSTRDYTPHAFAAHDRVKRGSVEALRARMQAVAAEQPGLVRAIGMKGFDAATDSDWQDIRDLGLDQSDTQISAKAGAKCHSG